MKTITEKQFKAQQKEYNKMLVGAGVINPYTFNHKHGVSTRGRVIKGVQKVTLTTTINGLLKRVSKFISHSIGYNKKR